MSRKHKTHPEIEPTELAADAAEANFDAESMDSDGAAELADSRIQQLEKQLEEEHNLYLRTLADFQNYRRRQEEENRQIRQFSNRELILSLLPILDNFERALAAAEQSKSYESLIGGVALTLRQMQDFLKKQGVEPIDAVGKEF